MRCRTALRLTIALAFIVGVSTISPVVYADATDVSPAQQHDLAVYGSTPGGIACAIRAAREGLRVVVISPEEHLGGMLTSGLSTMDTLYNGSRAPIYDELRRKIGEYYAQKYGPTSPQYLATQPGHPKTRYEASIVEKLLNEMIAAESRIKVIKPYYPVGVKFDGTQLRSVEFRHRNEQSPFTISADVFADCSYEADLAAVAKVPYRVGREARSEFGEPHAGIVFMRKVKFPPPQENDELFKLARRLNLFQYEEWYEIVPDVSTGEADEHVQGFNMRTIVTTDPGNRLPVVEPPNYNPVDHVAFNAGNPQRPGLTMPNQKFGLNLPKLIGEQTAYVEGDWATRKLVHQRHKDATLGMLYFCQNDPSVPLDVRTEWQKVGLPKDEFADNDHFPYEIYARETRRIVGRAVFTEHDAKISKGLQRAPIHADSISITEWFLDSHTCTTRTSPGCEPEGMVMLKNQTFPGQVSYRTMLPSSVDNLIVPVCLSASHIGWGTIRLEPTWMSIAEAAAFAIVQAKRHQQPLPAVDCDALAHQLAEQRIMLTFFNDVEGQEKASWYPAVQYLGTQGFFGSYDARPTSPLTEALADTWIDYCRRRIERQVENVQVEAQRTWAAEQAAGGTLSAEEFIRRLRNSMGSSNPHLEAIQHAVDVAQFPSAHVINRAEACELIYATDAVSRSKQ